MTGGASWRDPLRDQSLAAPGDKRARRSTEPLHPHLQTAAGVLAAVGVAGAVLGGMAWTTPPTSLVSTPGSATERMSFSYSATVPESPAYDDTQVTAPEPVFRRLTDTVEVSFRYTGSGSGERALAVAAELSTASGWRSTVPLTRPVAVGPGEHQGRVVLDLAALEARASAAAEATGIPGGDVDVVVVPRVTTAAGEVFAPRLEFRLTPLQLTLTETDPAALTVEDSFTVAGQTRQPATISLLGRELGVFAARVTSILLLLVAVVGGLEVRERARRAAARPEAERIRSRFACLLVDVAPAAISPGRGVVDVPDFATLGRIAQRYGLLVLTWTQAATTTYAVQDEDTTYRYRTSGADGQREPGPQESGRAAQAEPSPVDVPSPRSSPAPQNRTVLPGR